MKNIFLPVLVILFFPTLIFAQGVKQLWGTTHGGGIDGGGIIFSLKEDGTGFKKRHDLKVKYQGETPRHNEFLEVNNKFYGITASAGAYGRGILFEWNPSNGDFIKKADFKDGECVVPLGNLVFLNNKIYGTAHLKSDFYRDSGLVIFEYDFATSLLSRKYTVSSNTRPYSTALNEYNGVLYGITDQGGTNNSGFIYSFNPSTNAFTIIKNLDAGYGMVEGGAFYLYNNKFYGHLGKSGTTSIAIFEIDPLTNSFSYKLEFGTGKSPVGRLIDYSGKLYGLIKGNNGGIYEWDPITNTASVRFTLTNFFDGRTINTGQLVVYNNKLYGATMDGGSRSWGTLFEWNPVTNNFSTKYEFPHTDGAFTALYIKNGIIYGSHNSGGTYNAGRVFSYNPATSVYKTEFQFLSDTSGVLPINNMLSKNGKLFGVTNIGGKKEVGAVFEFSRSSNTYKALTSFDSGWFNETQGRRNAGLPDGTITELGNKIYGFGQDKVAGQIFEWSFGNNQLATKKSFGAEFNFTVEGYSPQGGLVYFNNKFYGTTSGGGNITGGSPGYFSGVLFEWDPVTNVYIKKYDFMGGSSGANPQGFCLIGNKLYGLAFGGTNFYGVVFEYDPLLNTYTKKLDLNSTNRITGTSAIWQLTVYNNKMYGTQASNEQGVPGMIFEYDPASNIFTKKYSFSQFTGLPITGGLTLGSNGRFFGMSSYGGINNYGEIFEWNPATNIYTKKHDFDGINGIPYKNDLVLVAASVASPSPNSCTNFPSITIDNSNNNQWVPVTNEFGDVIAEINANGNNLGSVSTSVYIHDGVVREDASKKLYLNRSISISPQTQPTTPVDIRIYITEEEYQTLKNATNSLSQPSGINSITDLAIFKNNDACNSQLIASTSQVNSANVSYDGGGYVITGSVSSFSSFYFAKLNIPTSVTNRELNNGITLYPNPVVDKLVVNFDKPQTNVSIRMISAGGRIVKSESYGTVIGTKLISAESLTNGYYIIEITASGVKTVFPFIKK